MGGKAGANPSNALLGEISKETFDFMKPAVAQGGIAAREFLGQATEGMKTGGVAAQIPLINRMVENAKSALSKSLIDTQYSLGKSGLAKSPFGQSILASGRISGESGIANIGPTMAMDFIKMIPAFMNASSGASAPAISGLSSAAQAGATQAASENQAYAQIMSAAIPKTSIGYQGGK